MQGEWGPILNASFPSHFQNCFPSLCSSEIVLPLRYQVIPVGVDIYIAPRQSVVSLLAVSSRGFFLHFRPEHEHFAVLPLFRHLDALRDL